MVEIDVYYFYWLSMLLYPLHSVEPGMPLSLRSGQLGIARVGLEMFRDKNAKVFRSTSEKSEELLEVINSMIPATPAALRDRPITAWEATKLKSLADALGTALRHDAKHAYVMCVEDQRAFSAHALVEKIEKCFPADAWFLICDTAKQEFEESGKCLALERYTGAGFHSLRGVECVIRQCIVKLTGGLPKKRDWGHYIEVLKSHRVSPNTTSVLENIRTLERNPVMHPEAWLDIDDAIGIFSISSTAIVRLADELA